MVTLTAILPELFYGSKGLKLFCRCIFSLLASWDPVKNLNLDPFFCAHGRPVPDSGDLSVPNQQKKRWQRKINEFGNFILPDSSFPRRRCLGTHLKVTGHHISLFIDSSSPPTTAIPTVITVTRGRIGNPVLNSGVHDTTNILSILHLLTRVSHENLFQSHFGGNYRLSGFVRHLCSRFAIFCRSH